MQSRVKREDSHSTVEVLKRILSQELLRSETMADDPLMPYKNAFYVDGSFRDIYIFETDEQDWQKLLIFLRSSPYSIEFSVDEQSMSLPERIETIFALREDHGTVLHIDKGHLALNCFFVTSEEIDCCHARGRLQDCIVPL